MNVWFPSLRCLAKRVCTLLNVAVSGNIVLDRNKQRDSRVTFSGVLILT